MSSVISKNRFSSPLVPHKEESDPASPGLERSRDMAYSSNIDGMGMGSPFALNPLGANTMKTRHMLARESKSQRCSVRTVPQSALLTTIDKVHFDVSLHMRNAVCLYAMACTTKRTD